VNSIIKKVTNVVNNIDDQGWSPLTIACTKGSIKIVKCLIKNGADINQADSHGEFPIIIACKNEYEEIVELLIKNGVNMNVKNKVGETPLTVACANIFKSIILLLVKNGADMNMVGVHGTTALIMACQNENVALVKYLIKNNADVNMNDNNNNTPLSIACAKENISMINILIEHGAYLNVRRDDPRQTPLRILFNKDRESFTKNYNPSHLISFLIYHFCVIKIDKYKDTGCFVKLHIQTPYKDAYGVLTTNHFLPSNFFNTHTTTPYEIHVTWFNQTFSINTSNFILSSEFLDVLFIELDEEVMKKVEPYFLEPSDYSNKVHDTIYTLNFSMNRADQRFFLMDGITFLLNKYQYKQPMSCQQLCLWYNEFYQKIDLDHYQIVKEEIKAPFGYNFIFSTEEPSNESLKETSDEQQNQDENNNPTHQPQSSSTAPAPPISTSTSTSTLTSTSTSAPTPNNIIQYRVKPIFNEKLEFIGMYTFSTADKAMVLEQRNILLALNTIYDPNNFMRARLPAKLLSPQEIEELSHHGLQATTSPFVFLSPASASVTALLFYRTNHAWYWTPSIPKDYSMNEIKNLNWSIIHHYEPIMAIGGYWNGIRPARRNIELIEWLITTKLKYLS